MVLGSWFLTNPLTSEKRSEGPISKEPRDQRKTTRESELLLDHGFVHQQNRYIVAHRIDPLALAALEALTSFLLHQRLLADRTYENFEKFL